MISPEFVVGSEKRFYDFISRLNEKDKIALISHTDLDGVASAKIVNEVINADIVKLLDYKNLTIDLVKELKKSKVKKVIFTDLYFKDYTIIKEIEKFSEIVIIDHHPFVEDINSDNTVFMNASGYCATYICYYLFSKIQNIEKWDWLAACASLSDFCYWKNTDWMSEIYKKYQDKFEIVGNFIRKNGKLWDMQYHLSLLLIYYNDNLYKAYEIIVSDFENIENIKKIALEVLKDIDNSLKKFEKEKIQINDGYFWEVTSKYSIKSILVNDISSRYYDKTIIIGRKISDFYSISIRRQDGKIDTNKLLSELVLGFEGANAGGHFKATGGFVKAKDAEIFKKKMFEKLKI
jgi:single-stranded DNA-specific DHH superfamily exonuclease